MTHLYVSASEMRDRILYSGASPKHQENGIVSAPPHKPWPKDHYLWGLTSHKVFDFGNGRDRASIELGISRKSIYNWMKDLGIPLDYK